MTATLTTEGHDWIHELCQRLSEHTGVWAAFLPTAERGPGPGSRILAVEPGRPGGGPDSREAPPDGRAAGGPHDRLRAPVLCSAAAGPPAGAFPERDWIGEVHNGQECVGRLHVHFPVEAVPDESLPRVRTLAALMADLITRLASAARNLDSRTRQVTTLVDMGRSLSGDRALIDSLNRLLEGAVQLSGFHAAAFFLLNPATSVLNLRGLYSPEPSPIPFPQRDLTRDPPDLDALARGRVLLSGEAQKASRWLPEGAEGAVCVPVKSAAGPIGTLWVYDRRRRAVSERDARVLESISAQIAVLLERVVLLRESSMHQRLRRDLLAASENQAGDGAPWRAADAALDAAALCASRYELGGDLCELIALGPHRTAVAVGDASGDGVQAALVMSAVRGALRALAHGEAEVLRTDRIVERVNRALHEITPCHQFMSLFYGVVDTLEGAFTYTNAGHPSPIHRHGGRTSLLETHGMLLGIAPDAPYDRAAVPFAAGDALVFFSDGVTEAMNSRGRMFRAEGILQAMAACPDGAAQDLLHAVWTSLQAHIRGTNESDDRTLLVLRMKKNS